MTYAAPTAEQLFALETIADLDGLAQLPAFPDLSSSLVAAILDETARMSERLLAPLNRLGDVEGARWSSGSVSHPAGFAEAYAAYVEAGWQGLAAPADHGGQEMPLAVATAVSEQMSSANMAFSLCMVLSSGAVEALRAYGSEAQKALYLPKLISGRWTGTMNLTEPQAGSDVGALRAMATPADDGSWRISGTKIFISWGEHDLAENIVHLVLARTPGSPAGTRGISLFVVPKFLPDPDGAPGRRNDLRCVSIEHKLGIHASPTCTMSFGDDGNCIGWLVGELHAGMRAMFAMMNHARLNIGLEGVAIAERAYQGALAFARERVQSMPIGGGNPIRIIEHPDVRRTLMTMRATTQAIRAIAYLNAAAIDRAHTSPTDAERTGARGLADLLTPITKAYATDMGVEVTGLGIQVFGGMGYVEETGAAQHWRDSRIAPIYEGTNGIQALDLVGRKLRADGGSHWCRLLDDIRAFADQEDEPAIAALRASLRDAIVLLRTATEQVSTAPLRDAAAVATPFLRMFGIVLGAYLLTRQAAAASARLSAGDPNSSFLAAKIATARFFVTDILPQAGALHRSVLDGSAMQLDDLTEEQFCA